MTPKGLLELPSPETMLTYASVLEKQQYVVKNGVEWRALPVDFPPGPAAWKFFERRNARGLPEGLVHRLHARCARTRAVPPSRPQ